MNDSSNSSPRFGLSSASLRALRGKPFFCLPFCFVFLLSAAFAFCEEPDFEKSVAPILIQNCVRCHNGTKARAGLNLSTCETALKGSDAGEVLVPGKPDESLLVKRAEDGSMPPEADGRRLTAEVVKVLTTWVKGGAKWPQGLVLSAPVSRAESSPMVPPRSGRRPRRLRIRRIHLHAWRDLSPPKHRGPSPAGTWVSRGGAGTSAVEPVGHCPVAAAAREAECNDRQDGNEEQFSHGSSPLSKRGRVGPS